MLENQTIGYESGNIGASLKVSKNLTVRSGKTAGKAIKGMVPVASGELVITSERIIYAGDTKSFEFPYLKLTNVEEYADGLILHSSSKSYITQLQSEHCSAEAKAIIKRIFSDAHSNYAATNTN